MCIRDRFKMGKHTSEQPMAVVNMTSMSWSEMFGEDMALNDQGHGVRFSQVGDGDAVYLLEHTRERALHWIWPTGATGSRVLVEGMDQPCSEPIELETLSSSPRVFFVHNFMNEREIDFIKAQAVDQSNPYSMRPSTTGHKSWVEDQSEEEKAASRGSQRTSQNAFVINGEIPQRVRQRAFRLLRLPWDEALADGLQVLRYEPGQAYITHTDYFETNTSPDFNWDPTKGGSNRLATVFLYLADVEEGGATVFPDVACDSGLCNRTEVPVQAKTMFPPDSWEAEMVQSCASSLAVTPKKGGAILFYHQHPDGRLDPRSRHGACPVISGQKWGANMWAWNACRFNMCKDPQQPVRELRR
eukprot:TRINITY_DN6139_c0_g1_i4.p1 TRINITY_DN6139_c0_g1~~TRINITY_DN6139_c0_g1_i4.p1  ORF type:complete len:357 (-),score=47.93 TRINITY_DN6139_c0_g1_i4:260-1330(-)